MTLLNVDPGVALTVVFIAGAWLGFFVLAFEIGNARSDINKLRAQVEEMKNPLSLADAIFGGMELDNLSKGRPLKGPAIQSRPSLFSEPRTGKE